MTSHLSRDLLTRKPKLAVLAVVYSVTVWPVIWILKNRKRLTVKTFRGGTFLHWGHNYTLLGFFHRNFVCDAVGGRFTEDGVFFESQYRLYAVDGGRVVPRDLDGACGGRQALVHHHHLGGWSKEPHLSVEIQNNNLRKRGKITTSLWTFLWCSCKFPTAVGKLYAQETQQRYRIAQWIQSIFRGGF